MAFRTRSERDWNRERQIRNEKKSMISCSNWKSNGIGSFSCGGGTSMSLHVYRSLLLSRFIHELDTNQQNRNIIAKTDENQLCNVGDHPRGILSVRLQAEKHCGKLPNGLQRKYNMWLITSAVIFKLIFFILFSLFYNKLKRVF